MKHVLKYTPEVNDELVKTYNFIVREKLQFSQAHVSLANAQTSGYHPSNEWCAKFLTELSYIEECVKIQPEMVVTYRDVFVELDGRIRIGDTYKTYTYKSFSATKLVDALNYFKTEYVKVQKIIVNNQEYLTGYFAVIK